MDEGHGANRGTDIAGAARGLVNFSTVDLDLDGVGAGEAAEEGDFHVWDDWGSADDETFDADEFVRVYPIDININIDAWEEKKKSECVPPGFNSLMFVDCSPKGLTL